MCKYSPGIGIGPAAYVVNAGDLHPINPDNRMSKFADDSRLIVPACNSHTCESELANIEQWSANNNLQLNRLKSSEIIFYAKQRRTRPPDDIPTLVGIPRVSRINVLGVTLADDLTFHDHIGDVYQICRQLAVRHEATQSLWHERRAHSEGVQCRSAGQGPILFTILVGICRRWWQGMSWGFYF